MSRSQLQNILDGERGVTPERWSRLRRVLVSPDDWFYAGPFEQPMDREMSILGVSIDKLTLNVPIGRMTSSPKVRFPVLMAKPGSRDVDVLRIDDQRSIPIDLERTEADWYEPHRKRHRYGRTMNIYGCGHLLAVMSVDPYRRRCRAHRWKRGEHRGDVECDQTERCPSDHFHYSDPFEQNRCPRCSVSPQVGWWKCDRCRALNACADCDRTSALRPVLRFEIQGAACQLGLLVPLIRKFVLPSTRSSKHLLVEDLHIALDFDVPFESFMVFQKRSGPRTGRLRTVRSLSVSPCEGSDSSALLFGSRSRLQVAVYNKYAHLRDGDARGDPVCPPHARDAEHISRAEFRRHFAPRKRVPFEQAMGVLAVEIGRWGVVDLRRAKDSPWREILGPARACGMPLDTPSVRRAREAFARTRKEATSSRLFDGRQEWRPAARYFHLSLAQWLVFRMTADRRRCTNKKAERAARTLIRAAEDELIRLEASGLHLADLAADQLPLVQEDLLAALAPAATARVTELKPIGGVPTATQGVTGSEVAFDVLGTARSLSGPSTVDASPSPGPLIATPVPDADLEAQAMSSSPGEVAEPALAQMIWRPESGAWP